MFNKKYKSYLILLLAIISMLMACKNNPEQKIQKPVVQEEPEGLELSSEQMHAVGIEIDTIAQKNLSAVVKVNGQLAVPPQNKAAVSILSGGIINQINVLEGQEVKKGQILASIKNQELIKMQQDYLAGKNSFTYIKAEYERQKQLKDAGAGTGKFFQLAEANYNTELAKIRAYESQLKQMGIAPVKISSGNIITQFPVLAPIKGTIGHITASTGAFVQPGTSIMEVVDNSKIHCDLTVFEKDLMQVKIGQEVSFQLTNQANQLITGKINGINKSFENESKGVTVHAVINNALNKNLIPGMYVTALISTSHQLVPAVSTEAIVSSNGKDYIFVVLEEHKEQLQFKKIEVKTGVKEQGFVQINPLEKVKRNIKVVVKGAFYLESKLAGSNEE